jgi:pimeloyl-ACP methyl ester carboxylesterase
MARDAVIYVHGLYSYRADSIILRGRLAHEFGYEVRAFRYPALSNSMAQICAQLAQFTAELPCETLHFVGHSLGGLVIYRFLERYPDRASGRVVFLGTPAVASRTALAVGRLRWAAFALGRCVAEELLVAHERRWTSPRSLGIIAGTRRLGLGQFFGRFDEENDGTIAVSETRLPGATDHITLDASHMGLLLSARAAHATGVFLRDGRFPLAPDQRLTSARSS